MGANDDLRATDHTGLRVLQLDDCLERIAGVRLGRLAFALDGEICILPVNHTLHGVDVCFRTSGDSKLDAAVGRDKVAFEVDDFDPVKHTGWSVLVQGTAVLVTEADEVTALEAVAARSWVGQHALGYSWVRIRTQSITGRELD
jgi:uncharacterized protein